MKGPEAQKIMDYFRKIRMVDSWEAVFAPTPRAISPFREPSQHRSPLDHCYKRKAPPQAPVAKKSRMSTPVNEPDWDRDPVDIQLLGPTEVELEFCSALAGPSVTFPPLERISKPSKETANDQSSEP